MPSPESPATLAAQLGGGAGLSLEDRLVLAHYHGTRDGARAAFAETFTAEFRKFIADYFDCQTMDEAAAVLGCSPRTIQQLWHDQKIPKDTLLGDKLPRTSLAWLREALLASRIQARTAKARPKLRALQAAA